MARLPCACACASVSAPCCAGNKTKKGEARTPRFNYGVGRGRGRGRHAASTERFPSVAGMSLARTPNSEPAGRRAKQVCDALAWPAFLAPHDHTTICTLVIRVYTTVSAVSALHVSMVESCCGVLYCVVIVLYGRRAVWQSCCVPTRPDALAVCWRVLTCAGGVVCDHQARGPGALAHAGLCWPMLADLCWPMLTRVPARPTTLMR